MASFLSTPSFVSSGQEELELAANQIDQSVIADRNYVDLSDLVQVQKHNQPTLSGLLDFDYPSLADPQIGLSSLTELESKTKVPLPAELIERFAHMQCNCIMGLFPEISRAWLSIDSSIYIWNYETGKDLAFFDGMNETIIAAGLVLPKRGVFQPHIEYLLCLVSPVDIALLGISFSKPHSGQSSGIDGEMHMLPEPLFNIATDNTSFTSIQGAHNGRIFMAAKDGCLYELTYQAEDGWFSRKCAKVNHSTSKLSYFIPSLFNFSLVDDDPICQISIDNSRNILYTRSDKGTIQVFDLGEKGQGMSRVAAVSHQTTIQNASLVAKSVDRSNFKRIVHIAALSQADSLNVHLVAVTNSGVRLYFTTSAFYYPSGRPSMLSLVHVRLPPGFSANASSQRPTNVHKAHYSKGTLLLLSQQTEDKDMLWTISSDAFPFQKQLRETQECTDIDGRVWALAEIPDGSEQLSTSGRPTPPLVVTQHTHADRRYVIINSQGSYLLNKLRPVDQLHQLLLQAGTDSDQVAAFFKLHKEQACATCLILATDTNVLRHSVGQRATRAFFRYGGEAEYNFNAQPANLAASLAMSPSYLSSPTTGPGPYPAVSTPYPNVEQQSFSALGHSSIMYPSSEVLYSAKHNGLCLYFARLVRPMWELSMVVEVPVNTPDGQTNYLTSRWTVNEVSFALNKLLDLKQFMEKNSQFSSALAAENYAAARNQGAARGDIVLDDHTRRKYQAFAERQETASLAQLQQLVARLCEVLALWKVLTDHQFYMVVAALTKDQQNSLRTMNLRYFVTTGKELSSSLITSLINMYIDDRATTDAISHRLREVAPSLYSTEDALCSKGSEKLQLAKGSSSVEREKHLAEALKLFKEISIHLDLPSVCTQFSQVRFYRGIVDLTLTAASRRDQQALALHYYKNGEPADDALGRHGYMERMECYKCITETLDYLLSTSQAHPQAPSVPQSPGPPPPADPNTLSNTDAAKYAEDMLSASLQSTDELLHVCLYDWMLRRGLSDRLLDTRSPYVEAYLQHGTTQNPQDTQLLDLLWKFYEKARNFSAAANILAKLADRHSTSVTLIQRVEYLSRAVMCAKSCTGGTAGHLLHELEEKMEVAQLQVAVLDALPASCDEARNALNAELLDITALYGEFADRYELHECKLAIIHCAGHYDPTLVESLWLNIIQAELYKSDGRDTKSRMKMLRDKLVGLGRVYATASDKYFPLAYLIKLLEQYCCELNWDATNLCFVFTTMQQIGVTVSRLQEIYDRLYKYKDPFWKNARKQFHLLYVIHQLLETFANCRDVVPAYERRCFTTLCLDSVASYLVELKAETQGHELSTQLRELQAKLERL